MDWITHMASAIAGGLTVLLPVFFLAWKQKNSIQFQQERDDYELDRMRKSDFGKELLAINEAHKDQISELKGEVKAIKVDHLDCIKHTAYLEGRVHALEEAVKVNVVAVASQAITATALLSEREARHDERNIKQIAINAAKLEQMSSGSKDLPSPLPVTIIPASEPLPVHIEEP